MQLINSEKGFSGIDIVISIGIIGLTALLISGLYFSLYLSNIEIERRSKALNYASQIAEKVSEYYFQDVTDDNFRVFNLPNGRKQLSSIEIDSGFIPEIIITNYTSDVNTNVLKTVYINISYIVRNKEQNVSITKYKTKEVLQIPNKPEFENNMIPILLLDNNSYKVVNTNQGDWYDYLNNKWAVAKTNSENFFYVWVPRFAYYTDINNITNIKFLYQDKNKSVNANGELEEISNDYIIPNDFKDINAKGYWIELNSITTNTTANILNTSIYGMNI